MKNNIVRVFTVIFPLLLLLSLSGAVLAQDASTCEEIQYITSVRTLSNEYWANWVQGAEWWAERNGVSDSHTIVTDEGDTQVQVSTIEQLVAEADGCVVINVTPTTSSAAESIVEAVEEAGGVVVTQWNKPEDLTPFDYDNWISHISYNGVTGGYLIAVDLFEAMGGEGNVVALQGILDTSAAQERFEGLQLALEEYPDITLLDDQPADFSRQAAQEVMEALLVQYGDQIDGVWTANDNMGLGALEALRARGLAGTIPIVGIDAVSEAIEAISFGDFTASALQDAYWQGGVGLEIGRQAIMGELVVADMPDEQRSFYAVQTIINADNVEDYLSGVEADDLDWSDPFDRIESQLDPSPET
jgi:ribose transport system substrate-binding protein